MKERVKVLVTASRSIRNACSNATAIDCMGVFSFADTLPQLKMCECVRVQIGVGTAQCDSFTIDCMSHTAKKYSTGGKTKVQSRFYIKNFAIHPQNYR